MDWKMIEWTKKGMYMKIFGRNGDIENCKLGEIFGQVWQDEKKKRKKVDSELSLRELKMVILNYFGPQYPYLF